MAREDDGSEILIADPGATTPGDGGPLRLPVIGGSMAGSIDIGQEWQSMGPGARDSLITGLRNQGYVVPQYVDLDSSVPPLIGPVPIAGGSPAGGGYGSQPIGGSTLDPGYATFLPRDAAGELTRIQLTPVINPEGGSWRLPFVGGAGATLPAIPGLGNLWNVLWWAALAYAGYKAVRRVPPSRVGSAAALPAAVAGLVMGFAGDRASRS